jgi:hypothetical protein
MKCSVEMASGGNDIYIRRFVKIGTGIQAILKFGLRNLRGFNVDRLRCLDVHTKSHKIDSSSQKVIGEEGHAVA